MIKVEREKKKRKTFSRLGHRTVTRAPVAASTLLD